MQLDSKVPYKVKTYLAVLVEKVRPVDLNNQPEGRGHKGLKGRKGQKAAEEWQEWAAEMTKMMTKIVVADHMRPEVQLAPHRSRTQAWSPTMTPMPRRAPAKTTALARIAEPRPISAAGTSFSVPSSMPKGTTQRAFNGRGAPGTAGPAVSTPT